MKIKLVSKTNEATLMIRGGKATGLLEVVDRIANAKNQARAQDLQGIFSHYMALSNVLNNTDGITREQVPGKPYYIYRISPELHGNYVATCKDLKRPFYYDLKGVKRSTETDAPYTLAGRPVEPKGQGAAGPKITKIVWGWGDDRVEIPASKFKSADDFFKAVDSGEPWCGINGDSVRLYVDILGHKKFVDSYTWRYDDKDVCAADMENSYKRGRYKDDLRKQFTFIDTSGTKYYNYDQVKNIPFK